MKVAVSAVGKDLDSQIDPRFGRAKYFVVVDSDSGEIVDVLDNAAAQDAAHGAGINAATMVAQAGAGMVLTGRIGPKAFMVLQAAGVGVASDVAGTVRDAVERFRSGAIRPDSAPNADAHQGMPGFGGSGGGGMGMGGMGGMGMGRHCGTKGGGRGRGGCGCR